MFSLQAGHYFSDQAKTFLYQEVLFLAQGYPFSACGGLFCKKGVRCFNA